MRDALGLFEELDGLRRALDRAFEDAGFRSVPRTWGRFSFLPGRAARSYPLLNISEDEDNIYLEGLAPGLQSDSLKINLLRDQITLSGTKPGIGEEIKPDAYHPDGRPALGGGPRQGRRPVPRRHPEDHDAQEPGGAAQAAGHQREVSGYRPRDRSRAASSVS